MEGIELNKLMALKSQIFLNIKHLMLGKTFSFTPDEAKVEHLAKAQCYLE